MHQKLKLIQQMKQMKKTTIKMKNNFKPFAMVLLAVIFGLSVQAQNFNVESVKMELESPKDDTEKDLDKCIEWITAASNHSKTANSPKMWFYKGLTYLKIAGVNSELTKATPNAIDLALEGFTTAIKTDTKGKYTEDSKLNLLNVAIGLYNRGYSAYQEKNYSGAYDNFSKTLPLMDYDTEGQLKRNNLTAEVVEQMMAFSALGMKDNVKAKLSFESLIKKGSSESSVFVNLANIHLEEKDTAKALEVIEAGKVLNGTDKLLINKELDIYLKQGRSVELIEKINIAIEDDPGNTVYYFARAISYEGMGDLEKAGADYDKILEIDPEYYDAAYNKGVMYNNMIGELVKEMDEKNVYKPSIIAQYEAKIFALYEKEIVQFEYVFENNDDMAMEDRLDLAKTMKSIYAKMSKMDKYEEMKAFLEENK